MVCGAGKNTWTPPRNSGRIPSTRFSVSIENEQADKRRYSQTCLAKPNSQARTGARKFSPVQLTINRIGNLTQLICTLLYVMTTHTCIRILYCRVYPQLPPVIGAPWGLKKNLNAFVAGTLRGYFLPVRYGSVGVQLTRLRALYQGTLTSGCVWKNLNTSYLYNAAILASFFLFACLKACFRLSLSTRNKNERQPAKNTPIGQKPPTYFTTALKSLVHKIRLHGRRGKGMAESFSREKLRHAPQKEGG